MSISEALGHIPTLPANGWIDSCRLLVSIWSGMLLIPMLLVARRNANYGFYALAIYVALTSLAEADQVGRPFVVYQLPMRALGIALATFWTWKQRNTSHKND